jgi:superfamily II DNA helicase RecQ
LEDFQKKALHQLLIDDKDLRLLPISAATGFGKSLIFTLFSSAYNFLNSAVPPVAVGLVADLNAAAKVDCKATVIVTPLISLINDKIANLAKFGCTFSLSFSRHA